jgi:hypothetical protein
MKKCILLFLFIFTFVVHGKCENTESRNDYHIALQTISKRSSEMGMLLKGDYKIKSSVSDLFGQYYDFSKSSEYIKTLEKLGPDEILLASDYTSLANCLNNLKLKEEYDGLVNSLLLSRDKKVELLKANMQRDDAIREGASSQGKIPTLKNDIIVENKKSEATKLLLEKKLLEGSQAQQNMKSYYERELSSFRNSLIKIRIDLIKHKISQNKILKEKLVYFEEMSEKLISLSSIQDFSDSDKNHKQFDAIESLWFDITQENFYQLLKLKFNFETPLPPSIPQAVIQENKTVDIKKVEEEIALVRKVRLDTISELTDKKKQEIKILNDLILQTNIIRSTSYRNLSVSSVLNRLISRKSLRYIRQEIMASPHRMISFFYDKYFYIHEKILNGRVGIIALVRDFFNVVIIVFLFWLMTFLVTKLRKYLDKLQDLSIRKYRTSSVIKACSSIWNKYKDSITNTLYIIILLSVKNIRVLKGYRYLIEICLVLLSARILHSLIIIFLGSISRIDMKNFVSFKRKANVTSTKFSKLFSYYFLIMIFIEATIGKVYIYSFVNFIALGIIFVSFLNMAKVWESEFQHYIERKFSGVVVNKITFIVEHLPNLLRSVFILFTIFVLSFFDLIIGLTEHFEISKKLSANVFKKQIEQIEAESGSGEKIPQEYKDNFSYKSLSDFDYYISFDEDLENSLVGEIKEWWEGSSEEHSLVVYGDKGMGKTTLLKHLEEHFNGEGESGTEMVADFTYAKMPSKTMTKESLRRFIASIFDKDSSDFDLEEIDKKLSKKKIIIIDEAQNSFLARPGGFEAYHDFITQMNKTTSNIFWVISFNKYSWLYLDRAFGRSQFFRNVFEVQGWSDVAIKELIIKRHAGSNFQLSYDLLISATKSQDEIDKYASVESKFFKLLWEMSRGNPRTALHLWLTALSRKNKRYFNVNVPKEVETGELEKLSDDLMFTLATILKHENLTQKEIETTTDFGRGVIGNALKVGIERKFLFYDERGRYMIDIVAQYTLIKYLRLKNFLYGK